MLQKAQKQPRVDTAETRSGSSSFTPELHRVIWSPVWDVAMRLAGLLWTGLLLFATGYGLLRLIERQEQTPVPTLVFAGAVCARTAIMAFFGLLLFLFIVRMKPLAKSSGLGARVVALGGTFLPTLLSFLPRYEGSALLNFLSFAMIAVGIGLAAYGFSYLNRSASLMPEARRLVRNGPYRFVRHPVYLFEEIAVIGILLPFLWSPPMMTFAALSIYAGHVWCQFQRMDNEEGVLQAAFPEYADYKRTTARLLPGLY